LSLVIERAVAIDVEIQVELEELEEMVDDEGEGDGSTQARGKSGLLADFDPFNTIAGQESDSDSEAGDGEGLEDIENFSDVSSEAEPDEDEEDKKDDNIDPKEAERRAKKVREMVAKLDGIIGIVLKWMERTWEVSSNQLANQQDAEQLQSLQHPYFSNFMTIFDRTILTTFKSRYAQFLIFYLVSLPSKSKLKEIMDADEHPQSISSSTLPPNPHVDMFLGVLLHNTLIPQSPPISMLTRIASASYLASFISRALCVGKSECRHVMVVCCQWVSVHLSELETLLLSRSNQSNSEQNDEGIAQTDLAVLYSIAQAIFLMFCFRWRELLDEEEEEDPDEGEVGRSRSRRWLPEMSIIQRLIVSPLNPLKVWNPNYFLTKY
jgi:RNA polymerase I-specific transcription initiation factor RRN3